MRLDKVLEASRCAEAAIDGGMTILIEQAEILDHTRSFWYDIHWPGRMRRHSDTCGIYGDLGDVADELLYWNIDVDALDWTATSKIVDLSDCSCKICKQFCLEHGVIPPGIPLYEALYYRARWFAVEVRFRCWLCWIWIKEYRWRRQLRAEYEEEQQCEEQEEAQ